mmetsp:Transcript_21002/g.21792  ORF Transcript_21002/g.21792 Transcript_21002/m.21792 type:complete len:102 (-) Transcript_21002:39-344(-)
MEVETTKSINLTSENEFVVATFSTKEKQHHFLKSSIEVNNNNIQNSIGELNERGNFKKSQIKEMLSEIDIVKSKVAHYLQLVLESNDNLGATLNKVKEDDE